MSEKIKRNVNGAFRVIKTFADESIYIAGTAVDIKQNRLVAELEGKGLIEKANVKVKAKFSAPPVNPDKPAPSRAKRKPRK